MKRRRRGLLAVVLASVASVAAPAFALDDPRPDEAWSAAQGEWRGTLTYRDDRRPDRTVTLPARLFVALTGPNELVLHDVFDDGPGKLVYSYESMRFDFDAKRVVFERRGEKDVERFTMTLWAGTIELAQDETDAAGTASFRNRFVFARA